MAAKPRYAATVVLLRGEGRGREVYMMKRNDTLAFLGGFYVFPGGALSREDCSPKARERIKDLSEEEAGKILGGDAEKPFMALGFWAAGIRELFEEAGVLLAETEKGGMVSFQGREDLFRGLRSQLHRKEASFWDILAGEGLYCSVRSLGYIDHWITPEFSPIRFDTRFFTARIPEGQDPSPYEGEASEGLWIRPDEALQRSEKGEMPMIPPTLATLRRLL